MLKAYREKGGDLGKINEKAIKFAIEGDKNKGVLRIDRPVKKDIAKAVWEMEQALVAAKVIDQEQADEFYSEVNEPPPAEKQAPKATPTAEAGKAAADQHKKDEVPAGTFNNADADVSTESKGDGVFRKQRI